MSDDKFYALYAIAESDKEPNRYPTAEKAAEAAKKVAARRYDGAVLTVVECRVVAKVETLVAVSMVDGAEP
jgi:hypothetical protein